MANDVVVFSTEEMVIDQGLGYPRAYAKLCRDRGFGPFSRGPPFTFNPYTLVHQEDSRANELDGMFPIIDIKAKPTTKPKIFGGLLWKQLNHLGNAGFDPETFRVDPYGNVLYYHADSASPLGWEIDHWFPCSRGGLTVTSNLRIVQWQVCKRKHNKLEFLIPWWELQIGVSINQFLSIFASSNSDFRHRAFSWLFADGESEELNSSQTVDSHSFPQHFMESKGKIGFAPAALVLSRRQSLDAPLKSLDLNSRPRSNTPIVAARKTKVSKENEDPLMVTDPYQAIVKARDSLKQREETLKMHREIQKLDNEIDACQSKTEEEKLSIQDLELVLIKKKRWAEKCRRLAESQCSYRAMLEKMIRDAMHQSVVYKEQLRLNQAASSALYARLEAQKAICDSAERELHRKCKQRKDLEQQMQPEWEHTRKRSKIHDSQEKESKITLSLSTNEKDKTNLSAHKELRKFLEEEQVASDESREMRTNITVLKPDMGKNKVEGDHDGYIVEERLETQQDIGKRYNIQFPFHHVSEKEEDEESKKERGKGNIEKWMQFLLENAPEDNAELNPQGKQEEPRTDEFIEKLNLVYPHKGTKCLEMQEAECSRSAKQVEENITSFQNPPYRITSEIRANVKETDTDGVSEEVEIINSSDENVTRDKNGKEKGLKRPDSFRSFRRIPSSPSLLLKGMKERVDCLRKKPLVLDDNDADEDRATANNSFIKSSIKSIKRAVRM